MACGGKVHHQQCLSEKTFQTGIAIIPIRKQRRTSCRTIHT
ncbi:hypothetical protein HMPREF9370_0367 [Neisseria wadsworthii 9715]|uniref:Uncharacterized protein n=1 Tax=Neisseria wadsworthii 9715 TaxID=1030841 RepID=G4CMQ8_9NEIS|nr:hypothetical protein HMPREF9370_0367 [Neisseria wadsworthii 9715]